MNWDKTLNLLLGIMLIMLGIVAIAGSLWASSDAVSHALAEPANEWGRNGAKTDWAFAAMFLICGVFIGIAAIISGVCALRDSREVTRG